ncbi:PAP fibrillin [Seminavis robusta]|uniref:PAP fibrillin n=1 Tax=Seminavis robusta TaxID=568900 RepID=A0A9N8DNT2_9STRA|nr:PAP fibrillin [Seminavis robusta]|eukprot:Sro248_g098510.1 PAP fibrillin (321) ;mRNA; r:79701-80663
MPTASSVLTATLFLFNVLIGCHGWTGSVLSRRQAFLASVSTGGAFLSLVTADSSPALAMDTSSVDTVQSSSRLLISTIPSMPYGAPATNSTIVDATLVENIETLASHLERLAQQRDNAISPLLTGNAWRLVYSNAPEIGSLADNLPPGFHLGKTYQPIDTAQGTFENRSPILVGNLAKIVISVVGDVQVAGPGTVNAVQVVNDRNNRVNVYFRGITFTLDEVFGIQKTWLSKTLIPNADKSRAQPANDVTYLDDKMRIIRGGDGSLFVFVLENDANVAPPTRSSTQTEAIAQKDGQTVDVGIGVAEKSQSPELQFLFQSR